MSELQRVGDLLSHRLGLYRDAFANKLEEGAGPERSSGPRLRTLDAVCAPGTCWDYQNVAYDASSEMVSRVTHMPYEQAVKRYLFNPIGMTSGSVSMAGLEVQPKLGAAAQRRQAAVADGRHLLQGPGSRQASTAISRTWRCGWKRRWARCPTSSTQRCSNTIHGRYVVTPGERGRMRKFLERLGTAWYGYGWRSYDYAGHQIIGHRGGIKGYR